jgi:hypothetical protein
MPAAQNEIIGIQIFRPFPFDALDLRFTQARFDRADDVQGDFVLESKNVVEWAVISFGPDMNTCPCRNLIRLASSRESGDVRSR